MTRGNPMIDEEDQEQPKVLLVDDDEVTLLLTSIALRERGFAVTEATSGERALRLLGDWLPDVVVLRHCKIKNAIIDRGCIIPEGTVIGYNHDHDRAKGFRVSEKGITLVTRDMLGLPVGYE